MERRESWGAGTEATGRRGRLGRRVWRSLAGLAVATIGLCGAGCGILYTNESRSMDLEANGMAGSAVTRAMFALSEDKGTGQWARWRVDVSPFPSAPVIAARLRAGTAEAPGAVLYLFRVNEQQGLDPKRGVIAESFTTPYDGDVRFEDLWDRFQKEPTYVEVELGGGAAPIAIGPLYITSKIDWHRDQD